MQSLLRKKIFLGYIIITAIVLFLTVVMVNERFRFPASGGILKRARHYGIADAFFCPRASAGSGCCSTSALPIKLQRCS